MRTPSVLDKQSLARGVSVLCRRDQDLAAVIDDFGLPPLWARPAGFVTLIRIILEQQVSLASADAAYRRLRQTLPRITPAGFLRLSGNELRAAGFSRQKTAYCRELAAALADKSLSLHQLNRSDDHEIRRQLTSIKGIGDWTVDIYMLMVLKRPDAWPVGDLALARAAKEIKRFPTMPAAADLKDHTQVHRVSGKSIQPMGHKRRCGLKRLDRCTGFRKRPRSPNCHRNTYHYECDTRVTNEIPYPFGQGQDVMQPYHQQESSKKVNGRNDPFGYAHGKFVSLRTKIREILGIRAPPASTRDPGSHCDAGNGQIV